ncbi:MAG: FHA domain-containing protein [Gemmatimonadetes bacterium]|nr:FHA domain-containing protein [Gemmatimonadota bacterium]
MSEHATAVAAASSTGIPVWCPERPTPMLVFPGGRVIEIPCDYWLAIGHLASQDVVLASRTVSGRHTALRCALDGAVSICDLGSVHGTFADGRRIRGSRTMFGPVYLSIGPDVHLRIESRAREQAVDGTWHPSRSEPQPPDEAAATAIRLRTMGVVAALHQEFEARFPDAMGPLDEAFALHLAATAPPPLPVVPYAPCLPESTPPVVGRTTAPGRVWTLSMDSEA